MRDVPYLDQPERSEIDDNAHEARQEEEHGVVRHLNVCPGGQDVRELKHQRYAEQAQRASGSEVVLRLQHR